MQQSEQKPWWQRFARMLRLRLIIPLLRSQEPPIFTARGVGVGLFVAFTPTVGVQMPICMLIWALAKWFAPSWRFNVIVAMAWTWVTNVFTLAPFYFLFVVTGQVLLGRDFIGYDQFSAELDTLLARDAGWLEALWVYVVALFDVFGLPMFLGSVPWALLFGYLGYRWSGRFVVAYRTRRDLAKARRRARRDQAKTRPRARRNATTKVPNGSMVAD